MDVALAMAITGIIAAGVCGGLLTSWNVHRRSFKLELRVADLEAVILSQRNKIAAQKRWAQPNAEEARLLEMAKQPHSPTIFDNEFIR